MGKRNYECTPWGMPTYNIFGWQKPCYLLQDGYADTFKELMETDWEWENYGTESGNPKCANCMVTAAMRAAEVCREEGCGREEYCAASRGAGLSVMNGTVQDCGCMRFPRSCKNSTGPRE
jgi:hypothetical protein